MGNTTSELTPKSPWTFSYRLRMIAWDFAWFYLCRWTPKPFNRWRLFVLRIFGAKLIGTPFVHQRARIDHPWNLSMENRSSIGDRAHAYCLTSITICEGATVAQEVYICTGTHDFSSISLPLITAPIIIKEGSFIGARSFLLPGVTIGSFCVIGACSVVTRSVPSFSIFAGNPARLIRFKQ